MCLPAAAAVPLVVSAGMLGGGSSLTGLLPSALRPSVPDIPVPPLPQDAKTPDYVSALARRNKLGAGTWLTGPTGVTNSAYGATTLLGSAPTGGTALGG